MPPLLGAFECLLVLVCVPSSLAWRFGVSLSKSGTFEPNPARGFEERDCRFCKGVLLALDLWADHARARGSLGNFSFDIRDDESNHTLFQNNMEELAQDDSIHFLLGPANSDWNEEASSIAAQHGKVLIKWSFDLDIYDDTPFTTLVDLKAVLAEEVSLQGLVPSYPAPTQISDGSTAALSSANGLSFDINIPQDNWTGNTIDLIEEFDSTFRYMFIWFTDFPSSIVSEQQCMESARYTHSKGAEVTYLPMHYYTQMPREMSLLVAYQPDVIFVCGPNQVVHDLVTQLEVLSYFPSVLALGRPFGREGERNWRSAMMHYALQPVPISPPDLQRLDPVFGTYLNFLKAWSDRGGEHPTYEAHQVVGACSLIFAALSTLANDQVAFSSEALAQSIRRSRTSTVLGWLSFDTSGERLVGQDLSPGTRQMLPWEHPNATVFDKFTHNQVTLVSNVSRDSCRGSLCREFFLDRMAFPGKLSWTQKALLTYPCGEGCLLRGAVCTPCSRGSRRGHMDSLCKQCEPGTYATTPGSSECNPCPQGAMCRTGMPHTPAAGHCRVLPWNGSCHGSYQRYLSVNRSLLNDGLTDPCVEVLEPEPFFQACLPSRVCTGGDVPCIGENQGLLCGQCRTGQTYTGVGAGRRICKDCPSRGEMALRLLLLALFYGVVVFTMSRWALRSAVSRGFMPTPMFRALVHYLHMVSCICENTRLDAHPFLALCLTPLDLFWRPLELVSLDCLSNQSPEQRMIAANLWKRPDLINAIFSLPIGISLLLCYHMGFALVMYLWNNPVRWCIILLGRAIERAQHSQTRSALSRRNQEFKNNFKSMLDNVGDLESAGFSTPRVVDKVQKGQPSPRASSTSPSVRRGSVAPPGDVERICSADSSDSEAEYESPKAVATGKDPAPTNQEPAEGMGDMPRRGSLVQPRLEGGQHDEKKAEDKLQAEDAMKAGQGATMNAAVVSRKRPSALLAVPSVQGLPGPPTVSSPSSRSIVSLPQKEKRREHFERKVEFSPTGFASRMYSQGHERRHFHVRVQGIVRELLMWVLLTYPTVIRSFMKIGHCIAIRVAESGENQVEWRNVMDLDVVCDSYHRDRALNFATVLVFVLPFTILLFLTVQVTDLANIVYRRVSSIFTSGYKPDAYYWEVLMILRTGAMVRTASIDLLTLRCLAMLAVVVFFFCLNLLIEPFAAMERFALKKFDRLSQIGVMMLIALGLIFQEERDHNIGGYLVESGVGFGTMCFVVVSFNLMTFFSAFFWAAISPCCRMLQAILDNGGAVSKPLEYLLRLVRCTYGISKVSYFQDNATGEYIIDASELGWQEKQFFTHCLMDVLGACIDGSTELHTWLLQRAIHEVFVRAWNNKQAAARSRYESWGLSPHRLLMCSLFSVNIRNPDIVLDGKTLEDDDMMHITVEELYLAVQDVDNDILDHNGSLHKAPDGGEQERLVATMARVSSPTNGKPYTVASWDKTEGLNNVLEELRANGKLVTQKPKNAGGLSDDSSEEDMKHKMSKTPDVSGDANELLDEMEREMDLAHGEEELETVGKVSGEGELRDELAELQEEINLLKGLLHGNDPVQQEGECEDSRKERLSRRMSRRRSSGSTVVQETKSWHGVPIQSRPDSADSCGHKIDELTADQFNTLARVSLNLQAAGVEHRNSLQRTLSPEETTVSGGGERTWTPSVSDSFASNTRLSSMSTV